MGFDIYLLVTLQSRIEELLEPHSKKRITAESLIPKSVSARFLQYHFLAENTAEGVFTNTQGAS